jgi:hypothetical protein
MNTLNSHPKPTQNPRPDRRVSLGLKLPVAVIGLLFIALVVFSYLSIQLSQQALVNTLKKELEDQAIAKVGNIQTDLLIAKTMALDLATVAEIENLDEAVLIQVIGGILR